MWLSRFWQLARHWKQGDKAKLELSCEDGSLHMQLSAVLGHPDLPHFPHPPPPPPFPPASPSAKKNKSPSQLRRQERRRQEGLSKQKEDSDKLVSKNVFEAEIEKPAVKPAENSADESVPQFKCNQCLYKNITEKGLAQHIRMKHKISQVDGNIDSEEEVLTVVVEDNKSETFDPDCFHMLGITEECVISCNKKFSSKEECYKHMYLSQSKCCIKLKSNLGKSGYEDNIRKVGLQKVMLQHTLKTHGL